MKIAVIDSAGPVTAPLVDAARSAGHDVAVVSGAAIMAQLSDVDLQVLLDGIDAVIDVSQSPTLDAAGATAFYTSLAARVGRASTRARVRRTVVLSFIGVDRCRGGEGRFAGYARAKQAHEMATRAHASAVQVVRSAQLHDLASEAASWGRCRGLTRVQDLLVQPVDVREVVRVLLEAALGWRDETPIEVAGPQPERLVDMAAAFLASCGGGTEVVPVAAGGDVTAGMFLPGPDAICAGATFAEWLGSVRTRAEIAGPGRVPASV